MRNDLSILLTWVCMCCFQSSLKVCLQSLPRLWAAYQKRGARSTLSSLTFPQCLTCPPTHTKTLWVLWNVTVQFDSISWCNILLHIATFSSMNTSS